MVSAINSVTYSYALQYQYFGTAISDNAVQALLQQYGVQETWDAQTDLQNLYQAMSSTAASDVSAEQAAAQSAQQTNNTQNPNNVPWANLMNQIGLSPTGDFNTDYTAFNNRISAMQSSAATSSPDAQAYINQMQSEAGIVFVQPTQSTSQDQSTQTPTVSGADIQAALNKLYALG